MSDFARAKRERLRWEILASVESQRPAAVSESVLRAALAPGRDELRRELLYLDERRLLQLEQRPDDWRVTMTWPGIDVVDYVADCGPGIGRPPFDRDAFTAATRGVLRWRLLAILDIGRGHFVDETLIWRTANDAEIDATPARIRRNLDYLEKRQLVDVERSSSGNWRAKINRHGIDLVEYAVDCAPGIARPPKDW